MLYATRPEADKDLIFSTDGELLIPWLRDYLFDTGGNIGINDSGPNFHLDVNGNVALREGKFSHGMMDLAKGSGDVYMDSSDNFVCGRLNERAVSQKDFAYLFCWSVDAWTN